MAKKRATVSYRVPNLKVLNDNTTLSRRTVALIIGVEYETLATWSQHGKGPPFRIDKGRAVYRVDDVRKWITQDRKNSEDRRAWVRVSTRNVFDVATLALQLAARTEAEDAGVEAKWVLMWATPDGHLHGTRGEAIAEAKNTRTVAENDLAAMVKEVNLHPIQAVK